MNTLLLNTSINTSLGHTIVTLVAFVILLLIVKHLPGARWLRFCQSANRSLTTTSVTVASEKAAAQDANRDAQLALWRTGGSIQIILQAKK